MDASARRPRRRFPRPLLVAVAFLLVAGVAAVFLAPEIRLRMQIAALDDDPQGEHLRALVQSPDARTDDLLVAALHDDDRPFRTRHLAAVALARRQRLLPLEEAVRDDDVGTRAAVLAALSSQRYLRHYVEAPDVRAEETIAWLLAASDPHALERGLSLVRELQVDSLAPRVREILETRTAGRDPSPMAEVLVQAGDASLAFRDCGAIDAMMRHAETSESLTVRRGLVKQVHRATRGVDAPCAGAVPEDRVRAAVLALLEHEAKEARMTALMLLALEPEWARALADDLRAVLASPASPEVRRHALGALLAARDEATTAALPQWLHDPEEDLRAHAVRAIATEVREGDRARLGCLVGVVRNEAEIFVAFEDALRALRAAAGEWVGLPSSMSANAMSPAFRDAMEGLFRTGEHRVGRDVIDRDAWSDAWFTWLAERLGVEADRVPAALQARAAFHAAHRDGDVAAAKAALPGPDAYPPGLFCWERAWVERSGP